MAGMLRLAFIRSRFLVLAIAVAFVAALSASPSSGQRASDDYWVSTKLGAIGPDSGPARSRWFGHIRSLSFDLSERLLIGYESHGRGFVARVNSDGTVVPLVGSDKPSATSPVGSALEVAMEAAPQQIVALNDGSILLATQSFVWRYTTAGNVERWGADVLNPWACPSLPPSTIICSIRDIRKSPDGSLLIADVNGYSIFRVSASGLLAQRLAGIGVAGASPPIAGSRALSVPLVFPLGVFTWAGRPHFVDNANVWRIDPDGALREVATLRSEYGAPYVRNVAGVTTAGTLVFADSESVYSHSLSGAPTRLAGGGTQDPTDGLSGSQLLMANDLPIAVSGAGDIAFIPRGDSVVFRLGSDRVLRHYAGRIFDGPISSSLFRNEIASIAREEGGSLLLTGGYLSLGAWRFRPENNAVAYAVGSQYPWPTFQAISARTLSPEALAPGCGGEMFVKDGFRVVRVSAEGVVSPIRAPGSSEILNVPILGGGCGFVAAVDYSGNLLRLYSDGTSVNLGLIPPPSADGWAGAQKVRLDGRGGVLLTTNSGVQRYSNQGQWSVVYPGTWVADVAATGGDWLLVSRFDLYERPVVFDLIEVSPTGEERKIVDGLPQSDGDAVVDGLAVNVPMGITSFVYDPGGFVWAVDRGRYVRSIRYSPPQGVPQATASVTTVPRRPAGAVNATATTTVGRAAASSAGGG